MTNDTRREFLKKAALLSGAAGVYAFLPPSVLRALTIDPDVGSTYLDAEHIVILMQENRSFDHCFGTLQGVRGFNDPRAIQPSGKNSVWLQTTPEGETHAPFRLNIKETKATWMGSLPHTWPDQVDARNGGNHDQWLRVKKSTHPEYSKIPLTLGYYSREDLPFYYSLADAFTVCDQNFCSSLTGTTPNRLYLWTGTIRDKPHHDSPPLVMNEDLDYDLEAGWTTFPERLEEAGVSWKIYQNEISLDVGLEGEAAGWLANFGDNPLENFIQFNVRFLPAYIRHLPKKIAQLNADIERLELHLRKLPKGSQEAVKTGNDLLGQKDRLKKTKAATKRWTLENYGKLTARQKNLHQRAFATNADDPAYHELTSAVYRERGSSREIPMPKGDILHQFRKDVSNDSLPTVSWLVAPENFSDHPSAPWYGAWYVSEAMDILTKDPAVWKKTIFILCYDENDGYFDHIPPFVPPDPARPGSGLASEGIDVSVEQVALAQEVKRRPVGQARSGPIGLGYRVPLVIASPWSRGGAVNSQVFDHTSIIQFVENFITHKTGKKLEEPNLSSWRRAVCGDLTSVFQPYRGEKIPLPTFVERETFMEGVHRAQFKKLPTDYAPLTQTEIAQINRDPNSALRMPAQEKGVRSSNALPYQLYAEASLSVDQKILTLHLEASREIFKEQAAGSPFQVYSTTEAEPRAYAVKAGDRLTDTWQLDSSASGSYHLEVYGPNGFYRVFAGDRENPVLETTCDYSKTSGALTGELKLMILNPGKNKASVLITDHAYKRAPETRVIMSGDTSTILWDLSSSFGWYDVGVTVSGSEVFERRYAGRIETGRNSFTDPAMGRVT